MNLKSVLVTGANRGIGLEMIRQLVAGQSGLGQPRHVFACYRDPSRTSELKNLVDASKNEVKVHLLTLEVTNDKHIDDAVNYVDSIVGQDGLNLLINNAGTLEREGAHLPNVNRENLKRHFDVNVASPILIAQAFLPILRRASSKAPDQLLSVFRSAVINISSGAGSIALARDDSLNLGVGYRVSKAALNMATKCFAVDLNRENILFVSLTPGWVKTDMGSMKAISTPEESVSEMFDTMARFNEEHQGGFYRRNGTHSQF